MNLESDLAWRIQFLCISGLKFQCEYLTKNIYYFIFETKSECKFFFILHKTYEQLNFLALSYFFILTYLFLNSIYLLMSLEIKINGKDWF